MMQGCSTATCRKVGKKGFWQPCPDPALEETVLENQRLIDRNNKLLEEIMEILGQPSCCPSIQTTTWAPASTTSQGQMVNPVVLLTGGSNPKNSKMTQSVEVYSLRELVIKIWKIFPMDLLTIQLTFSMEKSSSVVVSYQVPAVS
eukprot:TRINITY_DN3860_c0_g1_i1.p1 TRINITY_DN3860_c0_g1~~TRINITY_DN3860_c0_g1_i1.p1  ORF type:complete len:145 (-),score=30.60 TRINITY_DN3860_c0_g1_i1:167-601(-)